jgi:hypothetical protein
MNDTAHRPKQEALLALAAIGISIWSFLPLLWGLFILGDYGDREKNSFPGFLIAVVAVSLFFLLSLASFIGSSRRPGLIAAAGTSPYLFIALVAGAGGLFGWLSVAIVFAIFYGVIRLSKRFSSDSRPPRDGLNREKTDNRRSDHEELEKQDGW